MTEKTDEVKNIILKDTYLQNNIENDAPQSIEMQNDDYLNSYENSILPQTSDISLGIFIAMMIISFLGIVFIVYNRIKFSRKKKKSTKKKSV